MEYELGKLWYLEKDLFLLDQPDMFHKKVFDLGKNRDIFKKWGGKCSVFVDSKNEQWVIYKQSLILTNHNTIISHSYQSHLAVYSKSPQNKEHQCRQARDGCLMMSWAYLWMSEEI